MIMLSAAPAAWQLIAARTHAIAMGHLPIAGSEGSLRLLATHPGRRFYIHMNNTNPVLDAASPEADAVRRTGIEIAMDGMAFEL